MMKIFSGIQPTGIPHLGNYIGALKQWNSLSSSSSLLNNNKPLFCIVDLHAITSPSSGSTSLRDQVKQTAAALYSIMDENSDATIFVQSAVPYHTELAWYFASCTQYGELQRMTQWKAKSNNSDGANCGLFTYPVLQAADIALYRGDHVPVGVDQLQHLELSRSVIGRFNKRFSTDIPLPKPLLGKCAKIMSLRDPRVKMSKSDRSSPLAIVNITDDPDMVLKKFRKAVTDSIDGISYDPKQRPGISNLLSIMASLNGDDKTPESLAEQHSNWSASQLKNECAQLVIEHLRPIRDRYNQSMTPDGLAELEKRLVEANNRAMKEASENMEAIRDKVMNHRRIGDASK